MPRRRHSSSTPATDTKSAAGAVVTVGLRGFLAAGRGGRSRNLPHRRRKIQNAGPGSEYGRAVRVAVCALRFAFTPTSQASADPPVLMCRKHVVERGPRLRRPLNTRGTATNDPRPTTAAQMSARRVGSGVQGSAFLLEGCPQPVPISQSLSCRPVDREARAIISAELGHSREQITRFT